MFFGVADRYKPAEDGETIAPGVNVISTPGHTPGHAAIILSSGTQRAFILGDAISCPVQLTETEWSGMGDADPKLARRSQEAVVREIESDGALTDRRPLPRPHLRPRPDGRGAAVLGAGIDYKFGYQTGVWPPPTNP